MVPARLCSRHVPILCKGSLSTDLRTFEERDQAFLVIGGQLRIKRATVGCFGQQLAYVATEIIDRLAFLNRLASKGAVSLQQGAITKIDFHFERNAEEFAIT
jgi:hypothetical protein